jgi:hypothetical protein
MEDIVAIRVRLESGVSRYFLTWGRIFDAVHESEFVDTIRPHVLRMVRDKTAAVELCDNLQEASQAPYFFEAFFKMCQEGIPYGPGHQDWRMKRQEALRAGKEIYFLGA